MKKRKKIFAIVFLFLVLIGIGVSLTSISVRNKSFNASKWKQTGVYLRRNYNFPTPTGNIERAEMLDDLIANHIRRGMTRQTVQRLLGGADAIDGSGDHGPIDVYDLVEKPSLFQFWQLRLWFRYRTSQPALELEYGSQNNHLINIIVEE